MKSIKQELDSMNVKIDELKEKSEKTATVIDDNEVWRLRHEILSFANSCKNKKRQGGGGKPGHRKARKPQQWVKR